MALLELRLPPVELEARAIELRFKHGLPILGRDGRPLNPQPKRGEIVKCSAEALRK
jgi:hypothetical protein